MAGRRVGFGSGEGRCRYRQRIIHTSRAEKERGPLEPRAPGAPEVNKSRERGGCRVYRQRLCGQQPEEAETWCWEPEKGAEDAGREDTTTDL